VQRVWKGIDGSSVGGDSLDYWKVDIIALSSARTKEERMKKVLGKSKTEQRGGEVREEEDGKKK